MTENTQLTSSRQLQTPSTVRSDIGRAFPRAQTADKLTFDLVRSGGTVIYLRPSENGRFTRADAHITDFEYVLTSFRDFYSHEAVFVIPRVENSNCD